MNTTLLRKWLPIALCCLPGVAVAAIVGIGLTLGGAVFGTRLGGPLGLGLVALAILACPISMGLMMRRSGSGRESTSEYSSTTMECCLPGEEIPTDQLASLRSKRVALEREVAEMQTR